jgi:hypothetical protein
MAMDSRYFRVLAAACTVLVVPLLGGCLVVPYPGPLPDASLIEESTLDSLLGTSREDVENELGRPDFVVTPPDGENSIVVYRELGSWGAVFWMVAAEYGAGGGLEKGEDNRPFCYLLELDGQSKVVRYEVESRISYSGRLPTCFEILSNSELLADAESRILEFQIGRTFADLIESLGEPDKTGTGIMVYEENHPFTAVVAPGRSESPSDSFACFVFQLDAEDRVTGYRTLRTSWNQELPSTSGPSRDAGIQEPPPDDCAEAFSELQSFALVDYSVSPRRKLYLQSSAENGDWEAALILARDFQDLSYLEDVADRGHENAAMILYEEFQTPEYAKALAGAGNLSASVFVAQKENDSSYLESLARDGNAHAAASLARDHDDTAALRALAGQGDKEAARVLAVEFDDLTYMDVLKEADDSEALYALYSQIKRGTAQKSDAWRLLCAAANQHHPKAQAEVGYWHRVETWENWSGWKETELDSLRRIGVRSDNRIAYMWYTLAARNDSTDAALTARNYHLADKISPEEMAQAERMANVWRPGECPNPGNRLVSPGGT